MLLLTIYIFRRTFNISSNGNRKYLLASLRANFPYSVSTFVQQENGVTAAWRQNSFFLPTPQWKKPQQNHFNPVTHSEYSIFVASAMDKGDLLTSYVETSFWVYPHQPWEQCPFTILAIPTKDGWACSHRKLHSCEKVFLPCSGWTASGRIGFHWMAWGWVPQGQ